MGEVLSEAHGASDASSSRGEPIDQQPAHDADRGIDRGQGAHLGGDPLGAGAVGGVAGERGRPPRAARRPPAAPRASAIPAPSASTRSAFHGWSANSGTTAIGTPPARPMVTVPEPPWQTIAATCGMRSACGTQRSTRTLAGTGPSSAGSRSRPMVTSSRTGRPASASMAARYRPGKKSMLGAAEPKVT